jgi:hypothetical protein
MSDHIPTFADICSAIAEGRIAASIDGGMYQVNARELRRYFSKPRSLPSVSFSDASDATSQPTSSWSITPSIPVR